MTTRHAAYAALNIASIQANIRQLCAPELAGRLAGTPGEQQTIEAILSALQRTGLDSAAITMPSELFSVTVPQLAAMPQLEVDGPAGMQAAQYLVDFCVNVQGASAGGQRSAQSLWAGQLEDTDHTLALAGKIAICSAIVDTDAAAGLQRYLARLRRARDMGAAALLQVVASPRRYKVMAHCLETPGIPCLDISAELAQRVFASPTPALGSTGAGLRLSAPLSHTSAASRGNVLVVLGATPLSLLLCAHHDHVGRLPDGRHFAGASDNASGVALLLELGRVLPQRAARKGPGIGLLFSAAEELGMLGAYSFISNNINMLSQNTRVVAVDEIAQAPVTLLTRPAFSQSAQRDAPGPVDVELRQAILPSSGFSDAQPFLDAGLERIAVVTAPARPSLAHTLDDIPERIDPAALEATGRLLLRIVEQTTTHAGANV